MSAVAKPLPAGAPALSALERFLYHEARLLDEQRWEEWADLFVHDGEYWVPAAPGQADPANHVSLMYERDLLRSVRVRRYRHPNAFSLQPMPRTAHLVSNVMLDDYDNASGDCVVNSRFLMLEYRRDEQMVYGGACSHTLGAAADGFRIKRKRVDLVNCDAAMGNILVYF